MYCDCGAVAWYGVHVEVGDYGSWFLYMVSWLGVTSAMMKYHVLKQVVGGEGLFGLYVHIIVHY